MANTIGGSVVWNLTVDSGQFDKGIDQAATKANKFASDVKKVDFGSMASNASQSFGRVADSIGGVLRGLALMSVASGFGFGAMTKAAFAQVKQVEGATFALKAYETNGKKVTKVLSDLVKYARSDTGVLFQRQDLFDAASTLKIYGVETKNLTRYTKIMSKGVAIGKIGFQELSEVLGRVSSQGELTSDSFDILVRRGIKLPASMRNAKVSAEELFKALDKSLPDSILTGRANTIEGRMIRLQSAFRDLGGAILGVDKETSTFIKGGLGDQFVKTLEDLRAQLRDPAMVKAFQKMGKAVGDFTKNAIPVLFNAFKWLISNYDTVVAAIAAIGAAFIAAKIGEFASGIVEAVSGFNKFTAAIKGGSSAMSALAGGANPIGLIVLAIVALVAAMVYLQIKFGIFTKAWNKIKEVSAKVSDYFTNTVIPTFNRFSDKVKKISQKVLKFLKDRMDEVVEVFQDAKEWFDRNKKALEDIATVITALLLPKFVQLGVAAVVAGAKMAASAAVAGFQWTIQAIKSGAAWTVNFAIMSAKAIAHGVISVAQAILSGGKWILQATLSGAAWLLHFGLMSAKAIATAVIFVAQAIISGYQWVFQAGLASAAWLAAFVIMIAKAVAAKVSMVASAVTTGAAWKGVQTLIQTPIAMPAIAVAAAVASAYAVYKAVIAIRDAIQAVNSAADATNAANAQIGQSEQKAWKMINSGDPKKAKAGRQLLKDLSDIQYARGTNFSMAGTALVGEKGPELINLPRGSQVIPNHKLNSLMSPSSGLSKGLGGNQGAIYNIEIGSITLANDVDADRFIQKLTQQDDIISRGLTPQRYSNG